MPSWRQLLKKKKGQNLELGQLIFCYGTDLHCDILISLSLRKNEVDKNESVTSFSILAFSHSVCVMDSSCFSDLRGAWERRDKDNSFRTETIMKGLCVIIMHLSSLTSID